MPTGTVADSLGSLRDSWLLHLRAENKSDRTRRSYGDSVSQFFAFLVATSLVAALLLLMNYERLHSTMPAERREAAPTPLPPAAPAKKSEAVKAAPSREIRA